MQKCDKSFIDKQALRTDQPKVHTVLSIANLYLGSATFCLVCRKECHTRNHLRIHLQGQQSTQCIRTIAFWFPDPTGPQRAIDQNVQEPLRGHNRQQADARLKYHTFGPRLPKLGRAWLMPPVLAGYVTKAHTRAILPQQDLSDDVAPLMP